MSEEQAEQTIGDHQRAAQAVTSNPDSVTLLDAVKLIQQASGTRQVSKPEPLKRVVSGPGIEGRYIPTLSLDPGNVKAIEGFDDHVGYVQCAVEAFSICHVGLKALGEAREQVKKDTSKTEANQILIVAKEAEKLQDRLTRAMDSARTRLTDGIKGLDDSLSKPLTTAADTVISSEIRAYCKNLPDDKRGAFINESLKKRDTVTLNAVLGARGYLSGLSDAIASHYTRTLHEQQNPVIAARLSVMRKALELVESRAGLIFTEIRKALGARWDVVEKLRKASSAAEQALLLINNPVQP